MGQVDWDQLRLESGSFIDENLRGHSSDLLYSVPFERTQLMLYCLFEHQSTVDPMMPFRLLRYEVRIWDQLIKQGARKLPPIIPVVLHQGKGRWTISSQFRDLLDFPDEEQEALAPFIPDFKHALVDLSGIQMEQLRGELLLRTILSLMKAVREGAAGEWLERCVEPLEQLFADESDSALLRTLFLYLCRTDSNVTYATVEKVIEQTRTPTIRQNIMTIEEELRQRGLAEGRQQGQQEGRREGRQEGRQEGLLLGQIQACQRMLDQPTSSIEDLCGLPTEELQSLLQSLQSEIKSRLG